MYKSINVRVQLVDKAFHNSSSQPGSWSKDRREQHCIIVGRDEMVVGHLGYQPSGWADIININLEILQSQLSFRLQYPKITSDSFHTMYVCIINVRSLCYGPSFNLLSNKKSMPNAWV